MHTPNVTICSPFRDAADTLAEYINRIADLDYPFENRRYVFVEGDSMDNTWKELQLWTEDDDRYTLVKCDTGAPHYPSIVNIERFATLAQVFNAALDAVDLEWSDYVLFLPSDIRYAPDLLKRLLAAERYIISPFVWITIDGVYHFYDTWAFQRMGHSFSGFTPTMSDYGTKPIAMDTVGGVTLIKADVLRLGVRYTPDEVDRGLCGMAREKGFTVWADPTTHVYHPPFAPEQPTPEGLARYIGQDAQTVRKAIAEKYGFDCGEQYAQDFVAFVENLTHAR